MKIFFSLFSYVEMVTHYITENTAKSSQTCKIIGWGIHFYASYMHIHTKQSEKCIRYNYTKVKTGRWNWKSLATETVKKLKPRVESRKWGLGCPQGHQLLIQVQVLRMKAGGGFNTYVAPVVSISVRKRAEIKPRTLRNYLKI